jgi:hypothetical protein
MGRQSAKLLYAEILKTIAAVQKHYAGQTLMLGGTSVTAAAFVAELTAVAAQMGSVETARQAWLAESKALDTTLSTTTEPKLVQLHRIVQGQFGLDGQALVDFGLKPLTGRKRTAQQVVATAEKAAATRTARHTTGPRQKKAIHGTVTPPEPTPPAPTATPDAKPRG